MVITASAISLNVSDETASAAFLKEHFGFNEDMAADGFVSLSRDDVFLRTNLPTFKPERLRGRNADGLLIVFVVNDIDGECGCVHRQRPRPRSAHQGSAG